MFCVEKLHRLPSELDVSLWELMLAVEAVSREGKRMEAKMREGARR